MFDNFSSASTFVQSSGYLIIFIAMVIEGPIITTAAAFASSIGYLNIYIIIILSLLGDITGDIIYYYLGHSLRGTFVENYIRKHNIKKTTIKKLEGKIHNNLWKSMVLIKATPPLSTIGLLLIGASRIRFSRYILASIITTLPLTIFYITIGYYFGFAVKQILDYLEMGEYAIFFAIITLIILYYLYRFIYKKVVRKLS